MTLFDELEARRRKEEGIARASEGRAAALAIAQEIAVGIARNAGEVDSDLVAEEMERRGIEYASLGNAAGAVFRCADLIWTGRVRASRRASTHGRVIRIWGLRD